MDMKNVLSLWAIKILNEVQDYDIEEAMAVQYANHQVYEQFFKALKKTDDWQLFCEVEQIPGPRSEELRMLDLLDEALEKEFNKNKELIQI